jgi:hypothetical protein
MDLFMAFAAVAAISAPPAPAQDVQAWSAAAIDLTDARAPLLRFEYPQGALLSYDLAGLLGPDAAAAADPSEAIGFDLDFDTDAVDRSMSLVGDAGRGLD